MPVLRAARIRQEQLLPLLQRADQLADDRDGCSQYSFQLVEAHGLVHFLPAVHQAGFELLRILLRAHASSGLP
jgi:hypothetical protein